MPSEDDEHLARRVAQAARELVRSSRLMIAQTSAVVDVDTANWPEAMPPPLEVLAELNARVIERKFEADVCKDDTVVVQVKRVDPAGCLVRLLCFASRMRRILQPANIEVLTRLPSPESGSVSLGNYWQATVLTTSPLQIEMQAKLDAKDLPVYYSRWLEGTSWCRMRSLDDWREAAPEPMAQRRHSHRSRPSSHSSDDSPSRVESDQPESGEGDDDVEEGGGDAQRLLEEPLLETAFGLPRTTPLSLLPGLSSESFRQVPTAKEVRAAQDKRLVVDSTTNASQLVREGKNQEAIQLLNNALELDPNCDDAYVARAAAYANQELLEAAEQDLDKALTINPKHVNARTYMVQTLVARAKRLEEAAQWDDSILCLRKAAVMDDNAKTILDKALERRRGTSKRASQADDDVVCLDDEDERKRRKTNDMIERRRAANLVEADEQKKQREANRTKLAEMEQFIATLKQSNNRRSL